MIRVCLKYTWTAAHHTRLVEIEDSFHIQTCQNQMSHGDSVEITILAEILSHLGCLINSNQQNVLPFGGLCGIHAILFFLFIGNSPRTHDRVHRVCYVALFIPRNESEKCKNHA